MEHYLKIAEELKNLAAAHRKAATQMGNELETARAELKKAEEEKASAANNGDMGAYNECCNREGYWRARIAVLNKQQVAPGLTPAQIDNYNQRLAKAGHAAEAPLLEELASLHRRGHEILDQLNTMATAVPISIDIALGLRGKPLCTYTVPHAVSERFHGINCSAYERAIHFKP